MSARVPLVSVLIPVFNAERSIGAALASVLEADAALECVVVDDASTDRTLDVVRSIADRDARVVVVAMPENRGVSEARNRGLATVRGTWLTLVDADDRFLPGGLDTLVAAAASSDALAVIAQQVWWDGDRHWVTARYDNPDVRTPGRTSLAQRPGLLHYVSPHGKLLHRDAWSDVEFRGRVLGDQPWVIRVLLRAGNRVDVIADTVYEWYRPAPRDSSTSITATTRASVLRGVEAMGVAIEALAVVRADAEARLPADDAQALLGHYASRLIGVDLAAHVATALDRADPDIGALFDGVRAFLAAVPAADVAASRELVIRVLQPPLRRWARVSTAGRAAYWRLVEASLAIDSGLPSKGTTVATRAVFRLVASIPGRAGQLAVTPLLWVIRAAVAVRGRVRPKPPERRR